MVSWNALTALFTFGLFVLALIELTGREKK